MQRLYDKLPHHYKTYDSNGQYDFYGSVALNKEMGVFDQEDRIEAEFNKLRSQPGFLL
jgi:hypothetical protein